MWGINLLAELSARNVKLFLFLLCNNNNNNNNFITACSQTKSHIPTQTCSHDTRRSPTGRKSQFTCRLIWAESFVSVKITTHDVTHHVYHHLLLNRSSLNVTSHPLVTHLSPFRATRTPCVLLLPVPPSPTIIFTPFSPRSPPLPAAQFSFFNRGEQTNKTPWGNEATSGNGRSERSLAYWCGDWPLLKEKEGRYGETSCDLMEWIELSAARERKKGDKTKPRSVTRSNETTTFWVALCSDRWI